MLALASKEWRLRLLVLAVLLDLLAVSLVVPLLPVRFRELGVSAKALGAVSSVYSLSQIVGGLALGALSDRALGRRGLLLLNFVGAGTAYAIVGWPGAGFAALVGSRVVVGLCKQTMTASTALVAELTEPGAERALWVGRISSAAQVSWIAGQSFGSFLNTYSDPRYPSAVAVALYVVDFALVALLLPAGSSAAAASPTSPRRSARLADKRAAEAPSLRKALLSSRAVAATAGARLAMACAHRAAFATRSVYELERWDLDRGDAAYLSAFKSVVGVLSSWSGTGAVGFFFDAGAATPSRRRRGRDADSPSSRGDARDVAIP